MYSSAYVEAINLLVIASDNCAPITDYNEKHDAAYEFIEHTSTKGYIIGKQNKL